MCIRHTKSYMCPSKDGPASKNHVIASNVLCSHPYICDDGLWEQRFSRYEFMCPNCSGECPEIPRARSVLERWRRDDGQDERWAYVYFSSLGKAVSLWTWGMYTAEDSSVAQDVDLDNYCAMVVERRCKEKGHRPAHCNCDSNGPDAFMYNPATGVRRRLTNKVAAIFEDNPGIRDEAGRKQFERVNRTIMYSLHACKAHMDEPMVRQPYPSAYDINKRRKLVSGIIHDEWNEVENELLTQLEMGRVERRTVEAMLRRSRNRKEILKLMGVIMVHDNGISDERFVFGMKKAVHIMREPTLRNDTNIPALEQVASEVSEIVLDGRGRSPTADPEQPEEFHESIMESAMSYLDYAHMIWVKEVHEYIIRRANFDHNVTDVDVAPNADPCEICQEEFDEIATRPWPVDYDVPRRWNGGPNPFEAVSEVSNQIRNMEPALRASLYVSTPSMDGEMPVRINICGHIFGRFCLFQWWAAAETPNLTCPKCRAELPEFDVGLVPAESLSILEIGV